MTEERLPREELVEWVRLLRERGWTHVRIAKELCISRSYASMLDADPDRSKERARKDSYRGTCEGCGARTDGSNGPASAPRLCLDCTVQRRRDERYWRPETIIAAFQDFARVMGRGPAAVDKMIANGGAPSLRRTLSLERIAEADKAFALGVRLPQPGIVNREFGSWTAALRAAGLPPNSTGAHGHRGGPHRVQPAAAIPATTETAAETDHHRGRFVCPSCGDFTTVLYSRTGWCGPCTRAQTRTAA